MQKLKEMYPNLKFNSSADKDFTNSNDLFKDTIAYNFYLSGSLLNSQHPDGDYSDFLRQLLLYKFGGLYLDLDVVITRPFDEDDLPNNFAIAQNEPDFLINGAIMKFEKNSCFLKYHLFNMVNIRPLV